MFPVTCVSVRDKSSRLGHSEPPRPVGRGPSRGFPSMTNSSRSVSKDSSVGSAPVRELWSSRKTFMRESCPRTEGMLPETDVPLTCPISNSESLPSSVSIKAQTETRMRNSQHQLQSRTQKHTHRRLQTCRKCAFQFGRVQNVHQPELG